MSITSAPHIVSFLRSTAAVQLDGHCPDPLVHGMHRQTADRCPWDVLRAFLRCKVRTSQRGSPLHVATTGICLVSGLFARRCYRKPCGRARMIVDASKRRQKDPSEYANYDDIRASLQEEGAGGFSAFLNLLSEKAFGGQSNDNHSLTNLYRNVMNSPLLKSLDKSTLSSESYQRSDCDQQGSKLQQSNVENSPKAKELAMLLVCSKGAVARMASGYPEMLEMPSNEVLQRLLRLRELLPGCDVTRMVEVMPKLFLDADQDAVEASVAANFSLLKSGLSGADVEKMVQEDPGLLFWDLTGCVEKLYDLWDVDEETLNNCSAKELALAIRALSTEGPPQKY